MASGTEKLRPETGIGGGEFRISNCHEMALELICGLIFGAIGSAKLARRYGGSFGSSFAHNRPKTHQALPINRSRWGLRRVFAAIGLGPQGRQRKRSPAPDLPSIFEFWRAPEAPETRRDGVVPRLSEWFPVLPDPPKIDDFCCPELERKFCRSQPRAMGEESKIGPSPDLSVDS